MQNTPNAASGEVIKKAIHHQIGVLASTIFEMLSVTHALLRLFSTSGFRTTACCSLGVMVIASAIASLVLCRAAAVRRLRLWLDFKSADLLRSRHSLVRI